MKVEPRVVSVLKFDLVSFNPGLSFHYLFRLTKELNIYFIKGLFCIQTVKMKSNVDPKLLNKGKVLQKMRCKFM